MAIVHASPSIAKRIQKEGLWRVVADLTEELGEPAVNEALGRQFLPAVAGLPDSIADWRVLLEFRAELLRPFIDDHLVE
jgi:hypothetical protein